MHDGCKIDENLEYRKGKLLEMTVEVTFFFLWMNFEKKDQFIYSKKRVESRLEY